MQQRLMIVEDAFQIDGRGLVVVPAPLESDFPHPARLRVDLHRPDGSRIEADLLVTHHFLSPPPIEHRWGCHFPLLQKHEVPIGTEIWFSGTK